MSDTPATPPRTDLARTTLNVLMIVALLGLTIWILLPFLGAIVWATMIVVATWPVMEHVQKRLWGSRKLAVAVMTLALLLVLVVPLALAVGTLVANAGTIVGWASSLSTFTMPPPPVWLGTVPIVGTLAVETWERVAASPLPDVVTQAAPYATSALLWVAGTLQGVGWLMLEFLLTLAIAAVIYINGEFVGGGFLRVGRRLAGDHGERVVRLSAQAIRSVALGVIVTAVAQAALTTMGLAVAGVPFAALFGAVTFVLCIAQLGPVFVLVPAVGWLYWQGSAGAATGLLIWTLVVATLDNVIRPMLMSKGNDLPILLMFAGVMGGLLSFGLIGIFIGPVVLAVTYTLAGSWVAEQEPGTRSQEPEAS